MPKAILALRSYPLAILMALVLFLCSLILATSSTGIIGGGEDGGSGMGGTGKSGMPGDSGFGGTGGPSPFLGDAGTDNTQDNDSNIQQQMTDSPAPLLQRETETAVIPDEIAPLLELQRNPLRDPTLQAPELFPGNDSESLRILEQDTSGLPGHLRQQLDLANSGEVMTESAPVEIRLQIPEIEAPDPIDIPVLRRAETQQAQAVQPEQDSSTAESTGENLIAQPDSLLSGEAEAASQQSGNNSVAEHNNEDIPEIVTETPEISDPRSTTERIQRPELPPFQRMRPAVDRASILPSRPQPMRI